MSPLRRIAHLLATAIDLLAGWSLRLEDERVQWRAES